MPHGATGQIQPGERSLPEQIVAIHRALDEAKVSHAFGGALALAYYGEPRATIDVDVNVFVAPSEWRAVANALAPVGVGVGEIEPLALERDGQCRLRWDRTPVDLFFAYDPIHERMAAEVRRVPFAGTTVPILAPEHLAVCKAVFDRAKDWVDIEQILVAADDLDAAAVEEWLARLVGDDDPRVERFAELRQRLRPEG